MAAAEKDDFLKNISDLFKNFQCISDEFRSVFLDFHELQCKIKELKKSLVGKAMAESSVHSQLITIDSASQYVTNRLQILTVSKDILDKKIHQLQKSLKYVGEISPLFTSHVLELVDGIIDMGNNMTILVKDFDKRKDLALVRQMLAATKKSK